MFNNMSKKKLSAKNIGILSLTTTGLGISVSFGISYIMEWETGWTIALINTIANTPLLLASSDALRQELGLRSPIQIIGNSRKRAFGRKIPINIDGKQSNIFMQTLSLASGLPQQDYEPAKIDTISIWYEENEYTLTIAEIEEFIYVAWRRQSQKKNGLSRQYWTKKRRPRLKTLEYNIRIWVLVSCDGLIIDRSEGRSGRLAVSPKEAILAIRSYFNG
jgi:hypothetical protein